MEHRFGKAFISLICLFFYVYYLYAYPNFIKLCYDVKNVMQYTPRFFNFHLSQQMGCINT